MRRTATALFVIATFFVTPPVFADDLVSTAGGKTVNVWDRDEERARAAAERVPPELRLEDYRRAPGCEMARGNAEQRQYATTLNGDCVDGTEAVTECEDGPALAPLWRRTRETPDAEWSAWSVAAWSSCPEDLFALTIDDFKRLPLDKPALTVQPDRGWVLVNKETIVYTEDVTQKLDTAVLGQKIEVEAEPASWTWSWGDRSKSLTTKKAGKPYPHQQLWHVYEKLGTAQVTVAATWEGRWRLAGHTTWHDVIGTAETTAASDPFEIRELRSRLVAPGTDG